MKRALVIYGDMEIGNAIANGIVPVKRCDSESLRRVAMHQHTPEEWAAMIAMAQYDYGQDKPIGKLHGAILGAWALVWMTIFRCYEYLKAVNREA